MYGDHWFGGGFMWVFWVLLIIFIFWGARLFTANNDSNQQQSALDIIKERYARGEINQEEYEAKKRDLLS